MTASTIDIAAERAAVVAAVRAWLGTPFHHEARIQGAGVDCCQLLLAVYCGVSLVEEPPIGHYPLNWFIHTDCELVLPWIEQFCVPFEGPPALGDLALIGLGRARVAHAGIVVELGEFPSIIHADPRFGVCREELGRNPGLAARFAGYWTLKRWRVA